MHLNQLASVTRLCSHFPFPPCSHPPSLALLPSQHPGFRGPCLSVMRGLTLYTPFLGLSFHLSSSTSELTSPLNLPNISRGPTALSAQPFSNETLILPTLVFSLCSTRKCTECPQPRGHPTQKRGLPFTSSPTSFSFPFVPLLASSWFPFGFWTLLWPQDVP